MNLFNQAHYFKKALELGAFLILCETLVACSLQKKPQSLIPESLEASRVHYQMGLKLEREEEFQESDKQYRYALAYLQELGIDSLSKDSSLSLYLDSVLLGMESTWLQVEGQIQEDTVGLWLSEFEDIILDSTESTTIKTLSDSIDISKFSIPIVLNERVYEELHFLSQRVPSFMRKSLSRKTLYDELIYRELDSMDVPRDLIYQALVESGYKTSATSTASAGGIWQFIPSTGRAYGMKIDWWLDERRDPLKSTRGAISFMRDLHKQFGDWHLAMAAYNCGGGCVRRAIRKAGTKNYWELNLPKETKHYVPRIIAAAIIGHYPERYGIEVTQMTPPVWESTPVSHSIPLSTIAKLIDVPEVTLKALNPELRKWCTPSNFKNYDFKVPVGKRKLWEVKYAEMDKSKLKTLHRHKVRSGEYLGKIASRYGINISEIKAANNIKSNRLLIGQVLVIPLPAGLGAKYSKQYQNQSGQTTKIYKVRRGDNLYTISRKLGVSLNTLLDANKINVRQSIQVGQKLKYPVAQKVTQAKTSKPSRIWKSSELTTYKVKSGDNFSLIADKYDMTSVELMAVNKVSSSNLSVGQKLKVPKVGGGRTVSKSSNTQQSSKVSNTRSNSKIYTIKRGDNLYNIAQSLNVSLSELINLNNLKPGSKIQPGMKLRVPHPQTGSSSKRLVQSKQKQISISGGVKWYTVQSGDTLWQISKDHGVSVDELKSWNKLERRSIKPGMKIKIGESK
tara:strand:+ start:1555 stop:3756 length:2202 start_codon:yes stop_codon:yes gene_type:complete